MNNNDEEEDKKIIKIMEGIISAIEIISNKSEKTGVIECPVCGGSLSYSVAELNGHICGRCETEGCLKWMQ